mgnify:CR=1 FL=1
MIASSRRMVEELGITHRLLEADVFAGSIELLRGRRRRGRARRCGRRTRACARTGSRIDAAQAGGAPRPRAARPRPRRKTRKRSAGRARRSRATTSGRRSRGAACAPRRSPAAASTTPRSSSRAPPSSSRPRPTRSCTTPTRRLALAVALRAAGRRAESDAEEARAIELWDAKGATLLAGPRAARRRGSGRNAGDPQCAHHATGGSPSRTAKRRHREPRAPRRAAIRRA